MKTEHQKYETLATDLARQRDASATELGEAKAQLARVARERDIARRELKPLMERLLSHIEGRPVLAPAMSPELRVTEELLRDELLQMRALLKRKGVPEPPDGTPYLTRVMLEGLIGRFDSLNRTVARLERDRKEDAERAHAAAVKRTSAPKRQNGKAK